MMRATYCRSVSAIALVIIATGVTPASVSGIKEPPRVLPPMVRPLPVRPRLPAIVARRATVITPQYIIVDHGHPPATAYTTGGGPWAFNNTGQIAGFANSLKHNTPVCLAWTGLAWVDYSTPAGMTYCAPAARLGDLNATSHRFAAVVLGAVPFTEPAIAFYAEVSLSSSSVKLFTNNAPSQLYDVNKFGQALGYTYYAPPQGYFYYESVVATTGTSLQLLQSSCFSVLPHCMIATLNESAINSAGTILTQDGATGNLQEYFPATKTFVELPSYVAGGMMDDSGNVPYTRTLVGNHIHTFLYNPRNGTSIDFGSLPGNSCAAYYPYKMSGSGEVLGYTDVCTVTSDQVDWTWDRVHGLRNLNAGIPSNSYSYIGPIAVNDHGVILAGLGLSTGAVDWGVLVPR